MPTDYKAMMDDVRKHGRKSAHRNTVEQFVRHGNIRNMLIGWQIIDGCAVTDSENYDCELTLSRVIGFENELIRHLSNDQSQRQTEAAGKGLR